jgi:hypothetical protein
MQQRDRSPSRLLLTDLGYLGRAIAFRIASGQAHELPEAIPLLEKLLGLSAWAVADRN